MAADGAEVVRHERDLLKAKSFDHFCDCTGSILQVDDGSGPVLTLSVPGGVETDATELSGKPGDEIAPDERPCSVCDVSSNFAFADV